ncbi:MAG: chromosomal replication initiator protein DnaA [Patescibacteria group bacterium]
MDLVEIWRNSLGELEVSISRANFTTWFKNTFILDFKKGILTIGVPTFFVEDWLKKKYLSEIEKALAHQISEEIKQIKFKVATPSTEQVVRFEKDKVVHTPVDNKEAIKPTHIVQTLTENSTLNDYYRFDNFVVGSSNQLAYAAADAVSKTPGIVYNPLFIYGDSGLGKTHLMQAIGHHVLSKNPNKRILYVSSETFVNDYISAVESGSGKAKDFKNRYRNVDVLLIDDIQFLSGKEGTQEEFFHTFNHLHQNKKQVVLTADRTPKAIKGLERRLQTRFEGGMVADIGLPDLETRAAILRQKAKVQNFEVPDDVINHIAENIKSSVRELEGALTKIFAFCNLKQCEPNMSVASEILGNIIEDRRTTITPDLIIREICKYFHVPVEDLLGRKRNKEIVRPRQVAMYLLRHEASLSFPEIGREMGGKDHTTIMHGCTKVESEISQDLRLKDEISNIKNKVHLVVS